MSEDIHSDGTVETITRWRPGGAQGGEMPEPGECVMAVRVDDSWDYRTVLVDPDRGSDGLWELGEESYMWLWDDVEWWCPAAEIELPFIREPQS